MSPSHAETLSVVEFQDELRHIARFDGPSTIDNPLSAAVAQIERNPAFTQSRLLTRILSALATGDGDFRRAELATLDTATRKIVIALMDAARAGTATPAQWGKAVDTAHAAEVAAGR